MTFDESDCIRRVTRGSALFDAHYPGWEAHINLETLEMTDCENCVAGQVANGMRPSPRECHTGWGYILYKHFPEAACTLEAGKPMAHHGFVYSEDAPYWSRLLKERYDSGCLSDWG